MEEKKLKKLETMLGEILQSSLAKVEEGIHLFCGSGNIRDIDFVTERFVISRYAALNSLEKLGVTLRPISARFLCWERPRIRCGEKTFGEDSEKIWDYEENLTHEFLKSSGYDFRVDRVRDFKYYIWNQFPKDALRDWRLQCDFEVAPELFGTFNEHGYNLVQDDSPVSRLIISDEHPCRGVTLRDMTLESRNANLCFHSSGRSILDRNPSQDLFKITDKQKAADVLFALMNCTEKDVISNMFYRLFRM